MQLEDQQQNRAGWLFARGAFDKGDLLYLRDEEEKRRHVELDLREGEVAQFQAMRAQAEAEEERKAAEARRKAEAARRAQQAQQEKKRLLVPMVRLKPAARSLPSCGAPGAADAGEPSSKRPREGGTEHASSAPAERSAAEDEAHAAGRCASVSAGAQEDDPGGDSREENGEQGLAGLLGGYGSDSDDSQTGAPPGGNVGAAWEQQRQQGSAAGTGRAAGVMREGSGGALSSQTANPP